MSTLVAALLAILVSRLGTLRMTLLATSVALGAVFVAGFAKGLM